MRSGAALPFRHLHQRTRLAGGVRCHIEGWLFLLFCSELSAIEISFPQNAEPPDGSADEKTAKALQIQPENSTNAKGVNAAGYGFSIRYMGG
jgi:DsbC/DsbD-like thiol-disulfide interchange protein